MLSLSQESHGKDEPLAAGLGLDIQDDGADESSVGDLEGVRAARFQGQPKLAGDPHRHHAEIGARIDDRLLLVLAQGTKKRDTQQGPGDIVARN